VSGIDRGHARSRLTVDAGELLAKLRSIREAKERRAIAPLPSHVTHPVLSPTAMPDANEPASEPVNETAYSGIRAGFPRTLAESGLVQHDFVPDDSQTAAIEKLRKSHRGCLIGAAGTGKTTIMKRLVASLMFPPNDETPVVQKLSDVAFASFTGTASHVMKRMLPGWLQSQCMTIHSLLEYSPNDVNRDPDDKRYFVPGRTRFNKLTCKVLYLDESSMIPTSLWDEIIDALPATTRVIAVGDLNQLPPYGGTSAFGFMLSEHEVAELTTIHRQSDPAAQLIIEGAHDILSGRTPTFQEPDSKGDWACVHFELQSKVDDAAQEIVSLLSHLSKVKDQWGDLIYSPHRDRIITTGNGYDLDAKGALIQQEPLNKVLAPYFDPPSPDHPLTIIDTGAGTPQKQFAVGFRVMATKNEPPDRKERVTNGMLGRIVEIRRNLAWDGDWELVGNAEEVAAEKRRRIGSALGFKQSRADVNLLQASKEDRAAQVQALFKSGLSDSVEWARVAQQAAAAESEQRFAGPASHTVVVEFEGGWRREMMTQSQVASLMLAYATTVGKAQGAQHHTVVVICHHACKSQLSREFLYTAWTRAQRHVILLHTEFGLRLALNKQRIRGATLEEKIERYRAFSEARNGNGNGNGDGNK